jgi:hypothetical protein
LEVAGGDGAAGERGGEEVRARDKKRIIKWFTMGWTTEKIAWWHTPGLPDGGMYVRRLAVEAVLREALRLRGKTP